MTSRTLTIMLTASAALYMYFTMSTHSASLRDKDSREAPMAAAREAPMAAGNQGVYSSRGPQRLTRMKRPYEHLLPTTVGLPTDTIGTLPPASSFKKGGV